MENAIKKMYLDVPCQALGVPRKNSIYWWYRDDTHAIHGMGNMSFDTICDRSFTSKRFFFGLTN